MHYQINTLQPDGPRAKASGRWQAIRKGHPLTSSTGCSPREKVLEVVDLTLYKNNTKQAVQVGADPPPANSVGGQVSEKKT